MVIKAQALANFLIESTSTEDEPSPPLPPKPSEPSTSQATAAPFPALNRRDLERNSPEFDSWWLLKVDGSSGEAGSGAGVVLRSPDGSTCEHYIAFAFSASNNEAEYEALLVGLRAALVARAERLYILADSQLVVRQVKGEYTARDPRTALYLKEVKELLAKFAESRIAPVPRALNARADTLSKLGSTSSGSNLGPIYIDSLEHPSITATPKLVMQTETPIEPCWMDLFIQYLTKEILPENATEAKSLRRNALRYLMMDDQLYRMSYSSIGVGPYLRCL